MEWSFYYIWENPNKRYEYSWQPDLANFRRTGQRYRIFSGRSCDDGHHRWDTFWIPVHQDWLTLSLAFRKVFPGRQRGFTWLPFYLAKYHLVFHCRIMDCPYPCSIRFSAFHLHHWDPVGIAALQTGRVCHLTFWKEVRYRRLTKLLKL